jgi:hypothetical protein
MKGSHLATIVSELPLARRLLAPLREVREKEYGEPISPIAFPIEAFASEVISREEAWQLFAEVSADGRLSEMAATVATSDAEALAHDWEQACPAAEAMLALRHSDQPLKETETTKRALRWLGTKAGARAIEPSSGLRPQTNLRPWEIRWSASIPSKSSLRPNAPFDAANEAQTFYLLGVEPWASPLALTWGFAPQGWASRAPILRRWHHDYGCRVVSLSADTLEVWVARPPATADALSSTLVEAMAFCDGGADEGFAPVVGMLRGQAWAFRL